VKEDEMGETCREHVGDEMCTKLCLELREEKRQFGRLRRRWDDDKMYVREIDFGCVGWIHLAQDWDRCRFL
jgi:hypothetical protein